jgi:hypothetical protein
VLEVSIFGTLGETPIGANVTIVRQHDISNRMSYSLIRELHVRFASNMKLLPSLRERFGDNTIVEFDKEATFKKCYVANGSGIYDVFYVNEKDLTLIKEQNENDITDKD